jgi:hypothetical protein
MRVFVSLTPSHFPQSIQKLIQPLSIPFFILVFIYHSLFLIRSGLVYFFLYVPG